MNYTEITQLALSYADRNDEEVTSRIDLFLKVVESRINRIIKTSGMSSRTTIATVTDQEYYSLPADFAGLRDIEFRATASSDARETYDYLPPAQMNAIADRNANGHYYTLIADQLHILPAKATGGVIEIVYFQKLDPLTSSNANNWLSDDYPDVYLFALMVEISAFVKDKESKALWDARFKEALIEIQNDDGVVRWSGTPLQVRTS